MLRLVPAQAAAKDAAAAPQFDRHQIVVGRRKMRAGKTHQHAAIVDPFIQPFARRSGDIADVGENQHGQLLIEEAADRFRRRGAFGKANVRERIESA